VVQRVLKLVTTPTITDYAQHTWNGVRLLIHRDLPPECEADTRVPQWLQHVEKSALDDIQMIFVTPHGPSDRSGDYMPSLCSIRVIWRTSGLRLPGMRLAGQLAAERTLYHEIGHHAHRHGFGQIPHQEKEADRFAAACYRRAHPFMARVVAPLMWPFARLSKAIAHDRRGWAYEAAESQDAAADVRSSGAGARSAGRPRPFRRRG